MNISEIDEKCAFTDISVIQGRDCGVYPGGVAVYELCSEDPVQRCDAGELQPPCLIGILFNKTRCNHQVGARRSIVVRGRDSKQEPCRVRQTVATWEKPYECNGYGETLTGSAASENSGEDQ